MGLSCCKEEVLDIADDVTVHEEWLQRAVLDIDSPSVSFHEERVLSDTLNRKRESRNGMTIISFLQEQHR